MTGLCKYKHIFGKEGEGAHSIRFMGIAVVDMVLTILVCIVISVYFKVQFFVVFIVVMVVAVILHRLFCVNTAINKRIFGVV